MSRDVFFGIFASDNGGGEDGVGWGEARGNSERGEEVEFGDKGINERSGNEPPLEKKYEGLNREGGEAHTYVMTGTRRNSRLFQCLSI